MIERDLADARHDAHVQDDVAAVGDFHADLRIRRSGRAHQEGHHEQGAALHRSAEERCQLVAGGVRRHPVVGRTGIILVRRADKRQMLRARHIVSGAAMKVAARQLLLVQLDQLSGREAFRNKSSSLGVRSVAIHDVGRQRKSLDFIYPFTNCQIHRGTCRRRCFSVKSSIIWRMCSASCGSLTPCGDLGYTIISNRFPLFWSS